MIDFHKYLSLIVSLIILINCQLINGDNKYQKGFVSKTKTKSTITKYNLKPSHELKATPQFAETRAQHSVVSAGSDLEPAAGHGYYQYARVPKKGSWEFGYKRGNPHHNREQHEQGHGHQFKTKLRWSDKHGGHGEHYWDYNHAPKHGHGGGGGGGGGGHGKYGHGHGR